MTIPLPEVFARFRVAVDDEFRREYAFVDYRRWGKLESWSAGTFRTPRPARRSADDAILVYDRGELVGTYAARSDARSHVLSLLAHAPVDLSDLAHHLWGVIA